MHQALNDHTSTTDTPQLTAAARPAAGPLTLVVYALAACTFLMLTTEFVVAGLLPEVADDLGVRVGRAGMLITVFAAGMVVLTLLPTLRLAERARTPTSPADLETRQQQSSRPRDPSAL